MGIRFTYRDFSLIIGILVAAIIVLTLWMAKGPKEKPSQGAILLPTTSLLDHPTKVLKKVISIKVNR